MRPPFNRVVDRIYRGADHTAEQRQLGCEAVICLDRWHYGFARASHVASQSLDDRPQLQGLYFQCGHGRGYTGNAREYAGSTSDQSELAAYAAAAHSAEQRTAAERPVHARGRGRNGRKV